MSIRVKICCIASIAEAKLAIDLGADAIGLVAKIQNPPPLVRISQMSRLGNGSLQLSYSNVYGGDAYSVYASSNLFNWSPLGRATQAAPGFFQFTDSQSPTNSRRFYQLRWP